uniref:Phosphomethylpyrimidine kinase n=1 Tax=Mucochytrium quahogii TaxID=96639 RepID=A0A7S2SMA5_9STRA|mmetsp:Transcript_8855/g.14374  ORF Transcript_8855/g.14374 Transcript_8855/m.14374 type:complete len:549 (-) Transcript_8855:122-1768(-)
MNVLKEDGCASAMLWNEVRNKKIAKDCLYHPMVLAIAGGVQLEDADNFLTCFKSFIAQDSAFLECFRSTYGRVMGLAETVEDEFLRGDLLEKIPEFQAGVDEELKLHKSLCDALNISLTEYPTLPETLNYTNFLEKLGYDESMSIMGRITVILCGMLPCMRLYAALGHNLKVDTIRQVGEKCYEDWINTYGDKEFQDLALKVEELFDMCAVAQGGVSKTMRDVYNSAMLLEYQFFNGQIGLEKIYDRPMKTGFCPPVVLAGVPRVLIIAGSDSGGGAGIQADIKACTTSGVFCTTVVTALTSQNTLGVQGVFPIPASFVEEQMHSVLSDIGTDVVKTGMLASSEVIETICRLLDKYRATHHLVVDPVMISTSGDRLIESSAIDAIVKKLFPRAFIVTPNVPEAEFVLSMQDEGGLALIRNLEDLVAAAKVLGTMGPHYVFLKGGHLPDLPDGKCYDVLCDGRTGEVEIFQSERVVDTRNTHGTGCTLASLVAANLSQGMSVKKSVSKAKHDIFRCIQASKWIGKVPGLLGTGPQGPLNHMWQSNNNWQ